MLPRATALLALAGALVAGCGDDAPTASDAERFCGEAIAQREAIVNPPLTTEEELDATLDFYRLMGELAPLAIAEQWNDLVVNLETASTVVPGDPASEQLVATQAYSTERSAYEVAEWLLTNCGLDIGPITTIAPQVPVPARTSTLPPSDGSTASADG